MSLSENLVVLQASTWEVMVRAEVLKTGIKLLTFLNALELGTSLLLDPPNL